MIFNIVSCSYPENSFELLGYPAYVLCSNACAFACNYFAGAFCPSMPVTVLNVPVPVPHICSHILVLDPSLFVIKALKILQVSGPQHFLCHELV